MKNIIVLFVIVIVNVAWAQSWSTATTNLTIGSGQRIASTTDKQGIHVLYFASGTLKYARLTSSGSVSVSDVTVATGIGSYAAITTQNSNIYAVFEKNGDVYVSKSTNGGSSWASALSEYTRSNSLTGLDITSDESGVHVVWSEDNSETYYARARVNETTPNWVEFKEVTDYTNETGRRPTVAISTDEVHVLYEKVGTGAPRNRDFIKASTTWEDPITVPGIGGIIDIGKCFVNGSTLHVVYFEYASFYYGYSCYVRHYTRPTNSTSWTTITGPSDQYKSGTGMSIVKTNNGDLHMLYQKRFDGEPLIHVKYDGSSWSTVTTGLSTMTPYKLSSAGSDLFLMQLSNLYNDKLSYQQYDATPTIPTSMSFSGSSFLTVNWAYNPEPDIQLYEVWRKYYRNSHDNEDWILKTTRTTNSWVDLEFEYNGPGNIYTVYYKTKAKDNSNQMSSYSGEISTEAYIIFSKQGNLTAEENTPKEFDLKQNYPNPFNPTTTITFALPEASQTSLSVYDETGRDVAILFDGYLTAGTFTSTFDASKYSSGLYFYKIISGKYSATKKMLLMK